MAKNKQVYICSNCSYESTKWLGQCPACKEWNTFEELSEQVSDALNFSSKLQVVNLKDIDYSKEVYISSGFEEMDRVLGNGFVDSSVVLISGEPGIGKSTLLMQVLINVSDKNIAVYVSGEESARQLAIRANRLGPDNQDLDIITGFEISSVLNQIAKSNYDFVILDSVQSFYSDESKGLPGGFSQVKSVASKVVKFAKENNVTIVLVGQITKSGGIAGPKLLEHLVDVVLTLEGDENKGFRILRSNKNRFGSINEVGLFEMSDKGMREVIDTAGYFKDDLESPRSGVCFTAVAEGNRIFILEVQALTVKSIYSLPKRVASGISKSKLELICAIITKYAKIDLSYTDIFVNIAGGMQVKDPAVDLAVVLAIISSVKDKSVGSNIAAFGEVSLTGGIRNTLRFAQRKKEVERLGLTTFNKKFPTITSIRDINSLFN